MGVWACTASPVSFCTFRGGASSVCVTREDDTASFRAEWCRAARPVHPEHGWPETGRPFCTPERSPEPRDSARSRGSHRGAQGVCLRTQWMSKEEETDSEGVRVCVSGRIAPAEHKLDTSLCSSRHWAGSGYSDMEVSLCPIFRGAGPRPHLC